MPLPYKYAHCIKLHKKQLVFYSENSLRKAPAIVGNVLSITGLKTTGGGGGSGGVSAWFI